MPGVWTRSEIESLAAPGSFLRGVGYQRGGRVEVGDRNGDAVTAVVRGSMPYHVKLRRNPTVGWSCNCPVGEEGRFCKHCVAVALEEAGPDRRSKRPDRSNDEGPDVRKFVPALDSEALVDLVMEQVDSDWRLRERLTAQAIAYGGGSLDVRTWKRRIDSVFGDGRHFVPYAEAGGWARDIVDVLAALDDLGRAGHAVRRGGAC
jgi:uncharacterized Zn finger protein